MKKEELWGIKNGSRARIPEIRGKKRVIAAVAVGVFFLATISPVYAAVVYSALDKNRWGIYFQPDLSAPPKRIAATRGGDESSPALSPDGHRVAFEVQGTGIYVCALASSESCQTIRIDRTSAVRPAWHPKANEILFARYLTDQKGEEADIFVTQGRLTTSVPLLAQTGLQDYLDVSPDGRLLAYTSAHTISLHRSGLHVIQQLWVMDLQTGTPRQLLLGNAQDTQPDWAPSGEMLAFASNRTGQFEIWVVKGNGEGVRQVTKGPGAKIWPAWSPDGKSIMFTLVKDGRHSLSVINSDGTNLRQFEPFGPDSYIEVRDADWR